MARILSISIATLLVAACNSTTTDDAGTDAGTGMDLGPTGTDSGTPDTGVMTDAGTMTDSGPLPDLGLLTDAGGCSGVLLTVKNFDLWCSVSVGGGAASSAATQTICATSSSDVALVATALTGFQLGDWHHTTGDTGTGDPGTVSGGMSTADIMVGASGTACVWVCCPFTGGTGCPTTEQCP